MRTNDINYANLWPPIIRTQNHMNGTDVINALSEGGGSWGHREGKAGFKVNINRVKYNKDLLEHQYYISQDKTYAVGYVKNRTYNLSTRATASPTPCYTAIRQPLATARAIFWDDPSVGNRLEIDTLKKGKYYQIDWYTYFNQTNNGYIKSDCMKAKGSKGRIIIEYPPFFVFDAPFVLDRPVVWYVIHEGCTNGMAQTQNQGQNEFPNQLLDTKQIRDTLGTRVYPNPFKLILNVESLEDDQIIIQSAEGIIVGVYDVQRGMNQIQTGMLVKGVYLVSFSKQLLIYKLIKI